MAKSILVADERPTIRKVVGLTFSDNEFHVESVGRGAAAVRLLARLRPEPVPADVVSREPAEDELDRRVEDLERDEQD